MKGPAKDKIQQSEVYKQTRLVVADMSNRLGEFTAKFEESLLDFRKDAKYWTLRHLEEEMNKERQKFEAKMKEMSDMMAALGASIGSKKRGLDQDFSNPSESKRRSNVSPAPSVTTKKGNETAREIEINDEAMSTEPELEILDMSADEGVCVCLRLNISISSL